VDRSLPRRWSEAAIVGIVIYVALDVALVFLRPRFSVLHNAESDYGSRGRFAWVMDVNFVLRGLLSLAVAGALTAFLGDRAAVRIGVGLLGVWALASGLLAFFPDDPVGTRTRGAGVVHVVLALIAFLSVLLGTFATARALREDPRFAPIRRPLLALSSAAVVAILLLGHSHLRPHSLGGLFEKIFLGLELAWFLLVAAWIVRLDAAAGAQAPPR
jgi:hypothetical membrane protein